MHELSVASAMVNTAVKHAQGRKVSVVTVRFGALRQVVPDSLAFYWDIVARDSLCDGSRLEQILVPVKLRCEGCSHEWSPDWAVFRCDRCGSADVTILQGEELEVESIEIEDEEVASTCTA